MGVFARGTLKKVDNSNEQILPRKCIRMIHVCALYNTFFIIKKLPGEKKVLLFFAAHKNVFKDACYFFETVKALPFICHLCLLDSAVTRFNTLLFRQYGKHLNHIHLSELSQGSFKTTENFVYLDSTCGSDLTLRHQ